MSEEEKKDQQTEEQPKEETTEKPEEQKWDKDKQQKDQLESTIRNMSEKLKEADEEKQTLLTKFDKIEQAITQQQEKAKDDLEPVDDALVDPKVARNFQKLAEQQKNLAAELKESQDKIAQYEKERREYLNAEQNKQNTEKILRPLDEMYGAKYRTPATELANKMINDGDAETPKDMLEAHLFIEKCYKMVKVKDEAAGKKLTPTDSGFGGVPFDGSKVKTGTRDEVFADIKKRGLLGVGKEPLGH